MKELLTHEWADLLNEEFEKEYFVRLKDQLGQEYTEKTIFPPREEIFNALNWCGPEQTKVVILGQDPYHGPGQAHGLCFSVGPEVKIPPSLRNIYKELYADLGCAIPDHGNLEKWARQGVLMLNAVLTVRSGQANSHRKIGWQHLTDRIIQVVNDHTSPKVFILWGNHAIQKKALITNPDHLIIEAPHPSPLSAHRGFFGTRPFSRTNAYLEQRGRQPVDWCL